MPGLSPVFEGLLQWDLRFIMTDEMMNELIKKRNELNAEVELHRRQRDDLNDEARSWIEKRDGLNAKAKELAEKASDCKRKRDELNDEVRKAKDERDVWNKNFHRLEDRMDKLKRKKTPAGMITPEKLRKELSALEFKQMTSVMSAGDERALIDRMSKIQKEIHRTNNLLEKDTEVLTLADEMKAAYDEAEKQHKAVEDFANRAQAEHDSMVAQYEQSDAVRKEADTAQENFITAKLAADEEHRKHVELIKQVRDYDKMITGIRQKERISRKSKDEDEAKKQAEEIYNKFKQGEKLSTEDLMSLQKAGYL